MAITSIDVDVGLDPLPGEALHALLRSARERPGLTEMKMLGGPAYLISRFDELRAFFRDD